MTESSQDTNTPKRKPLTVSLLPEDEQRLLAIRNDMNGRATLSDAVREALKTEAIKRNLEG